MAALARTDDHRLERRRQNRVPWSTPGRFVFDDALEHRCRTIDVSTSGMSLMAPTAGDIGQRIVCYLDGLGRFEGRIVRLFGEGFAIEISGSPAKREQLARQLASTPGPEPASQASETPRDARLTPARTRAVLRLADARRVGVKIIDLSSSGAALICPIPLALGAAVSLGHHPAHVTRVARTVVGVRFDAPLGPGDSIDL